MGLAVGTPVASSLIDAHAGGLGMIGVGLKNSNTFRNRLGECTLRLNDFFLHDFQLSSDVRPHFIPYANRWPPCVLFTNNTAKVLWLPSMNHENIFCLKVERFIEQDVRILIMWMNISYILLIFTFKLLTLLGIEWFYLFFKFSLLFFIVKLTSIFHLHLKSF